MRTISFVAGVLALALWVDLGRAQDTGQSFGDSLGVAQGKVNGGYLIRARLEMKKGIPIFGFYFRDDDGNILEIEVDANSKKIVKEQKTDTIPPGIDVGEPNADPDEKPGILDAAVAQAIKDRKRAKIPFGRFLQTALTQYPNGKPIRMQVAVSNGKLLIILDIDVDGKVKRLTIDPVTGKVLSTEDKSS